MVELERDNSFIEITPFKSVAFLKLGDNIYNYLPESVGDYDQTTGWANYYFFNGNVTAYVEADIINSIAISTDCYLKSINLYKQNIDSFFEKLDIPLNFREITDKLWITEGEQQDIYEIENLGMQLWVNELRQIETIICALY